MPIVEVNHVTKEFRLGQLHSLRETMRQLAARLKGKPLDEARPFKALDDVDFKVEPGEVLGIIGQNGAGKSTLLKLLAGISAPTQGSVAVRGRVAPLIEVGAGLVPDLTGRENIFLNAIILGMKRREIKRKFDDIVGFAELEKFIDTPVKRYSSGMLVRLGFSIATAVKSEVLIVDEVLAVGDLAFQQKCFERMEEIIRCEQRTVLIVSHNVRQIEQIATRVMLLDQGRVLMDGGPAMVTNAFFDLIARKTVTRTLATRERALISTEELAIKGFELLGSDGRPTDTVRYLAPCIVRVRFRILRPLQRICFFLGIRTSDFVGATSNETFPQPRDFQPGDYSFDLHIARMLLLPGAYSFRLWIGAVEGIAKCDLDRLRPFQVVSEDYAVARQQGVGLVQLEAAWHFDGCGMSDETSAVVDVRSVRA